MKDETQAGDRRAREPCFLSYHEQQRVARPQLAGPCKTWMLHPERWTPNAGEVGPAPRDRRAPLKTVKNKTKTTRHRCRLCWKQWAIFLTEGRTALGCPSFLLLAEKVLGGQLPLFGPLCTRPQFCPCHGPGSSFFFKWSARRAKRSRSRQCSQNDLILYLRILKNGHVTFQGNVGRQGLALWRVWRRTGSIPGRRPSLVEQKNNSLVVMVVFFLSPSDGFQYRHFEHSWPERCE